MKNFILTILHILLSICSIKCMELSSLENYSEYLETPDAIITNIFTDALNLDAFKDTIFSKINEGLEFLSDEVSFNEKCKKRPNNHFSEVFGFAPTIMGKLFKINDTISFENPCFKKTELKLLSISEKSNSFVIEISSENQKKYFCKQTYLIATSNIFGFRILHNTKKQVINFQRLKQDDFDEIKVNGIKVFEFCHGFFRGIFDIMKTYHMLFDNATIQENTHASKEFLEEYGFTFEERENKLVNIEKSAIRDGDLFVTYDWGHTIIMIGTGGRVGHNAVALWFNDELYIAEASGDIHKIKYDDWLQTRLNQNIAYLPLNQEYRQKFNSTKAREFVNKMDGHQYGSENFIFTWFDTKNENLPDHFPTEIFTIFLSILEKFYPDSIFKMLNEGLLMRLGIFDRNLTLPQITAEAARRGLTIEELMAIPENDDFTYKDGKNYVCSSFVVKVWKEAGLFGDLKINPQEFTPKDAYQLKFFENDLKKIPQICRNEYPNLPYCIINGEYKITLPEFNSIDPYDNMNDKCPSVAPLYFRPEKC